MFFSSVVTEILQQPDKNSILMDAYRFTQASDIDEMSEAETLLPLYVSVPKIVFYYKTQLQHKSGRPPY